MKPRRIFTDDQGGQISFDRLRHWKLVRFIAGNFTTIELIELLLLSVLGLIVFTWYSSNLLVDSFDYNLSFTPGQSLYRSLHLWDPHGGFGSAIPRAIAGILPNNLYYASMQFVGFSLHATQSLLFYVILAGSGVSIFLLYRALGFGERYRNGAVFAAILYMFSPIASTFLWNQFASNYYSYCFMPLIAAMVVFGLRTRRGPFYIFGVIIIWTLMISASYMNPLNAFMDWVFILGLMAVLIIRESKRRAQVVKFAAILVILWVMVNIFWIAPILTNASEEFVKSGVTSVGVSNLDLLKSNSVPVYVAALQIGYWALYHTYLGDHWYSWSDLAASAIFIISCLIIAITVFYAFFIRPINHFILLLGIFTALCLIMINGYYPPTGDLMVGLFNQFPILYAFRSLYQHFGPLLALSYALLLGYAMANLIGSISWPKLKGFTIKQITLKAWVVMTWTILVLFALSVISIPYFTGQIIYDGGNVIPSARVQVPEYYSQTNEFLNNASGDFRVLALPYCQLGYAVFSWENGYWGGDPSSTIFDRVIITSESGEANELFVDIANKVSNNSVNFNLGKLLSIMNVKYVMLHEDANWKFIQEQSPAWWAAPRANFSMYDIGLKGAGMKYVATIGQLALYENPEWREIHFSQVNQTLAVVGGISAVKNLTEENWYDVSKMAFVMASSMDDINNLTFNVDAVYLGNSLVTLESWAPQGGVTLNDSVGSSTMHKLTLAEGQRYLVFSERYDEGWTMTRGESAAEHFNVNMFFNGWTVIGTGSVTVDYRPQNNLTTLVLFSTLFALGLFSYLTFRHLRRGFVR